MSYRIATNSFSAIGPANDAFTSFLKAGEDAPRPVILAHLSNTRELWCGVTATALLGLLSTRYPKTGSHTRRAGHPSF
jgi:hypothetical protein